MTGEPWRSILYLGIFVVILGIQKQAYVSKCPSREGGERAAEHNDFVVPGNPTNERALAPFASFEDVPVEKVVEFWDRRPCNFGWSFQGVERGSIDFFERVKERKFHVEPHIPIFAQFDKWKGKRVLEIGGGICTTAIEFAKKGANVTVVDVSPKSAEICQTRFELYGLPVTIIRTDAEKLDSVLPSSERFDLIWSFGVLHHTPHPRRIVDNVLKYLDEEGEFRGMVYSKFSYKLFQSLRDSGDWKLKDADAVIAYYSEAQQGSPVTYTYTFDEVRELFEGFVVEELRKDHIFRYSIDEYMKDRYIVAEEFRGMDPREFKALEKELGWHTLIRAKKKQSGAGELTANDK